MKRTSRRHSCFVIMPISDPKGYEKGHFSRVYEEIIKGAVINSGYEPVRTDDLVGSYADIMDANIIPNIMHSPIAICDLSAGCPNVLFELGFRLTHDNPTVVIQEQGAPQIYGGNMMPIINYSRDLTDKGILDDQKKIEEAIGEAKKAKREYDFADSVLSRLPKGESFELEGFGDANTNHGFEISIGQLTNLKNDAKQAGRYLKNKLEIPIKDKQFVPAEYDRARMDFYELKLMEYAGMPGELIIKQAVKVQTRLHLIKIIGDDDMKKACESMLGEMNKIVAEC